MYRRYLDIVVEICKLDDDITGHYRQWKIDLQGEREREVWRVRNLAARSTNLDVRLTWSEVTLACLSPHASSEGEREGGRV